MALSLTHSTTRHSVLLIRSLELHARHVSFIISHRLAEMVQPVSREIRPFEHAAQASVLRETLACAACSAKLVSWHHANFGWLVQ